MKFKAAFLTTLSSDEILQILQLRTDVFVVEQHCAYPEIDAADYNALHIQLKNQDDILVGAGRILLSETSCRIGRVVIRKEFRNNGLAKLLMQNAIQLIRENYPNFKEIEISAQTHLAHFYSQLGFQSTYKWYLEDLIPHVDMKMIL